MNIFVGKYEKKLPMASQRKQSKWLPWLIGSICIFVALYGTSYLALFWLQPYDGVDMRSQIQADYSSWDFFVIQPVDDSVIEEIQQERELPEQIIIDGSFWPTPNSANITPLTESETPISTNMATSDPPSFSATTAQSPYPSTPMPAHTFSTPGPVATLQAVETSIPTGAVNPATTAKPRKTAKPEKTSKPPKEPKH